MSQPSLRFSVDSKVHRLIPAPYPKDPSPEEQVSVDQPMLHRTSLCDITISSGKPP
jgi:hypothetical protein